MFSKLVYIVFEMSLCYNYIRTGQVLQVCVLLCALCYPITTCYSFRTNKIKSTKHVYTQHIFSVINIRNSFKPENKNSPGQDFILLTILIDRELKRYYV